MWRQRVSSLSKWPYTICPTPYNCKLNVLSASLNKIFPSFLPWYERLLMVGWIVGLIVHGGLIQLFLVPAQDVSPWYEGARCSSVVRAFAHGAMGRRIDPSWWIH